MRDRAREVGDDDWAEFQGRLESGSLERLLIELSQYSERCGIGTVVDNEIVVEIGLEQIVCDNCHLRPPQSGRIQIATVDPLLPSIVFDRHLLCAGSGEVCPCRRGLLIDQAVL